MSKRKIERRNRGETGRVMRQTAEKEEMGKEGGKEQGERIEAKRQRERRPRDKETRTGKREEWKRKGRPRKLERASDGKQSKGEREIETGGIKGKRGDRKRWTWGQRMDHRAMDYRDGERRRRR